MNQLLALVPDALNDARAIFARRWWLLLPTVVLAAVYAYARDLSGSHDLNAAAFFGGLSLFAVAIVLSGYIFADTMRIDEPEYALNAGRILVLVLIGLGVGLITLAAMIPGMVFLSYGMAIVTPIWTLLAEAVVTTRLGYVFFAAENEDGAFRYSWRITSGAAFLPSLVLAATYVIGVGVVQALVGYIIGLIFPFESAPAAAIVCLVNFGSAMFFSPWMIRWMRVAETLQTVVPE